MANYDTCTTLSALLSKTYNEGNMFDVPTSEYGDDVKEMFYFKLPNNLLIKLLVGYKDATLNINVVSLITHQTVESVTIPFEAFMRETKSWPSKDEEIEYLENAICEIVGRFIAAFAVYDTQDEPDND